MHCVKCGTELIARDHMDRTERWCAPCCLPCEPIVRAETRKNFRMWPCDYRGGYIWAVGQWWDCRTYVRPTTKQKVIIELMQAETKRIADLGGDKTWFTVHDVEKLSGRSEAYCRYHLKQLFLVSLLEEREAFRQGYWYAYEYRVKA